MKSWVLGDAIFYHVFCGLVKRLFEHAFLAIFQRDDRNYKLDLLSMNLAKNQFSLAKTSFPGTGIDSFQLVGDLASSGKLAPAYFHNERQWRGSRSHRPHLLLSPNGMVPDMLPCFESLVFLRIPDT